MGSRRFNKLINKLPALSEQIDLNERGHYSILLGGPQYGIGCWTRNNYSVFSTMGNQESFWEQRMFLYNHFTNKIEQDFVWGNYPDGDYHSYAQSIILRNGKILTVAEENHNGSMVLKMSDNPYDISSYTEVRVIDFNDGVSPAYGNLSYIGNRLYLFFRDDIYHNGYTYSDDHGLTWQPPKRISSLQAGSNKWAYPRAVYFNQRAIYLVNQRDKDIGTGEDYSNVYGYYIDGSVITNLAQTYSKDLHTENPISSTQMNANYLIGNLGFISATCADSETVIYTLVGNLIYKIENGVSSLHQTLTGDFDTFPATRAIFVKMGNGHFVIITKALDLDGNHVFVRIETFDSFSTFTMEEYWADPELRTPLTSFNFNDTKQGFVLARKRVERGAGTIQEPVNGWSDAEIIRKFI